MNINGEDNRTFGYNYYSIGDPTNHSDGSFENNLINT